MDRQELVRVLSESGVPTSLYDIPGVQDLTVQADAYYFLRPAPDGDGWVVGLREHSEDTEIRWFAEEDEACRDLLGKLTAPPPPSSVGEDRADEVHEDSEGIRREVWLDFERPLRRDPEEEQR